MTMGCVAAGEFTCAFKIWPKQRRHIFGVAMFQRKEFDRRIRGRNYIEFLNQFAHQSNIIRVIANDQSLPRSFTSTVALSVELF